MRKYRNSKEINKNYNREGIVWQSKELESDSTFFDVKKKIGVVKQGKPKDNTEIFKLVK